MAEMTRIKVIHRPSNELRTGWSAEVAEAFDLLKTIRDDLTLHQFRCFAWALNMTLDELEGELYSSS